MGKIEKMNKMRKDFLSSETLYHFTSRSIALTHILRTGELKFNRLCNTNDPLEYKQLSFSRIGRGNPEEIRSKALKAEKKMNELRRKSSYSISFSQNDDSQKIQNRDYHYGATKSRMWSQYGEDQKGVCLVYSKTKLLELLESEYTERVLKKSIQYFNDDHDYRSKTKTLPNSIESDILEGKSVLEYAKYHLKKHQDGLFFLKRKDYQDENEFRIIIHTWDNHDNETDITEAIYVDAKECLLGIIVGEQFPEKDKYKIEHYGKAYQCYTGRVSWDGQWNSRLLSLRATNDD